MPQISSENERQVFRLLNVWIGIQRLLSTAGTISAAGIGTLGHHTISSYALSCHTF